MVELGGITFQGIGKCPGNSISLTKRQEDADLTDGGGGERGRDGDRDGHLECRITHNFSSFSISSLDNFLIQFQLIFSIP